MLIKEISKNYRASLIFISLWLALILFWAIFKDAIVGFIYNPLHTHGNRINEYVQIVQILLFYVASLLLIFESWKKQIIKNRKYLLKVFCLCLAFFTLYAVLGLALLRANKGSDFFGVDYEWLLFRWDIWHKGSKPTLLLWSFPLYLLKYFTPLIPLRQLAVFYNASLGALAIFLSSFCFRKLLKNDRDTLLYCSLIGLSMSHLFFSIFPESRMLQICALIPTYIVFLTALQEQKLNFERWVFVGLLSLGITITNFSTTLVFFVVTLFLLHRDTLIQKTLKFSGAVLIISLVLSLIQKMAFPTAQYFFLPSSVKGDVEFIKTTILSNPPIVLWEIIKHFILVNIVAPYPLVTADKVKIFSYFGFPTSYSLLGLFALVLWLIWFFKGLVNNLFDVRNEQRYLLTGLILSIVPFVLLHSFFGVQEFLLYTTNFTFTIICLSIPLTTQLKPRERLFLVTLIIALGVNNLLVIKNIISQAGI